MSQDNPKSQPAEARPAAGLLKGVRRDNHSKKSMTFDELGDGD